MPKFDPQFWEIMFLPEEMNDFSEEDAIWHETAEEREHRYQKEDKKRRITPLIMEIIENELTYLCNNNMVIVDADRASQERRLLKRPNISTRDQVKRRVESQFTNERKIEMLEERITEDRHGTIWRVENSDGSDPKNIEEAFDSVVEELGVE